MPSNQENPKDQSIDALCIHCGQEFSTFLHQMEEQNAKVVCPHCGKEHDDTARPRRVARPARKR